MQFPKKIAEQTLTPVDAPLVRVRLIAFDSTRDAHHSGLVTDESAAWLDATLERYPDWVRCAVVGNPEWVEARLARNPQWINEQLKQKSVQGDLFA